MKRPWRLTRRERVAMEAALIELRADYGAHALEAGLDALGFRSLVWLRAHDALTGPSTGIARAEFERKQRTLRARLAIALRAALRADEDARAEEAYVRAYEKSFSMRNYGLAESAHAGAWWAIAAMRGWPIERRDDGLVPLALWEAAWRPTTAQQPSERPAPTDETP